MITREDLRRKLPGFERQEILASSGPDNPKLVYVFEIRGFMDELWTVSSFQIRYPDGRTECFSTLDGAYKAWYPINL